MNFVLFFIFFSILFGLLIISFVPKGNKKLLQGISITLNCVILFSSCLLLIFFNQESTEFQYSLRFFILDSYIFNLYFSFGLDVISIYFFILTSLLIFLCILFIWDEFLLKEYLILLFLIEFLLLLTFSILNLFLFYIFFEFILIPMYLLIGIWGSREKKIRAAYLLFFYTVCCSILMLIAILYIQVQVGTLDFEQLLLVNFSMREELFLWLAFFFCFASKIPLFPFHIWLPEAHVEAPTVGSVLLAGILLKLGVYGFLRYSITLFPNACIYFSPIIYCLSIFGIIYASLNAIKQTDFKKIIAYSSVAHMNLVVLGLFSGNIIGLEASIVQSVSHGFVASAIFFLIGMLYIRFHSRIIHYFGGIVFIMPLYSIFFLFFIMSNIALPGTSSFVGEFLLLFSIFQNNLISSIFAGTSVVLSGAYSLWLYNRIVFGNIKTIFINAYSDLQLNEFVILSILLILSLLLGIFPSKFLNFIHISSTMHFLINQGF